MDATAFALARENRMPIIVFSIQSKGAIEAVLRGEGRSTVVGPEPSAHPGSLAGMNQKCDTVAGSTKRRGRHGNRNP